MPKFTLKLYQAALIKHQKEVDKVKILVFSGGRKSILKDIGQNIFQAVKKIKL